MPDITSELGGTLLRRPDGSWVWKDGTPAANVRDMLARETWATHTRSSPQGMFIELNQDAVFGSTEPERDLAWVRDEVTKGNYKRDDRSPGFRGSPGSRALEKVVLVPWPDWMAWTTVIGATWDDADHDAILAKAEKLGYSSQARARKEACMEHYEKATRLLRDGQFEEGAGELKIALEWADEVDPLSLYAAELWRQGSFADAIAHARRALEKSPGNVRAHFALGAALVDSGFPAQAVEHLMYALHNNPAGEEIARAACMTYLTKAAKHGCGTGAGLNRQRAADQAWAAAPVSGSADAFLPAILRDQFGTIFELKRVLGVGGTASVGGYVDLDTGYEWAIKALRDVGREDLLLVESGHLLLLPLLPHVVAVHNCFVQDGRLYLMMDRFDGILANVNLQVTESSLLDVLVDTTFAMLEVSRALAEFKLDMSHGDLKADNVGVVDRHRFIPPEHQEEYQDLLALGIGRPRFCLLDFGAAGVSRLDQQSRRSTDIYLLGHMWSGLLDSYSGSIDSRISALVAQCMAHDPANRPMAFDEILDQLEVIAAPKEAHRIGAWRAELNGTESISGPTSAYGVVRDLHRQRARLDVSRRLGGTASDWGASLAGHLLDVCERESSDIMSACTQWLSEVHGTRGQEPPAWLARRGGPVFYQSATEGTAQRTLRLWEEAVKHLIAPKPRVVVGERYLDEFARSLDSVIHERSSVDTKRLVAVWLEALQLRAMARWRMPTRRPHALLDLMRFRLYDPEHEEAAAAVRRFNKEDSPVVGQVISALQALSRGDKDGVRAMGGASLLSEATSLLAWLAGTDCADILGDSSGPIACPAGRRLEQVLCEAAWSVPQRLDQFPSWRNQIGGHLRALEEKVNRSSFGTRDMVSQHLGWLFAGLVGSPNQPNGIPRELRSVGLASTHFFLSATNGRRALDAIGDPERAERFRLEGNDFLAGVELEIGRTWVRNRDAFAKRSRLLTEVVTALDEKISGGAEDLSSAVIASLPEAARRSPFRMLRSARVTQGLRLWWASRRPWLLRFWRNPEADRAAALQILEQEQAALVDLLAELRARYVSLVHAAHFSLGQAVMCRSARWYTEHLTVTCRAPLTSRWNKLVAAGFRQRKLEDLWWKTCRNLLRMGRAARLEEEELLSILQQLPGDVKSG